MSEDVTREFVDGQDHLALTFGEWMLVKVLADARMKASNGHRYTTMLKTRCDHCGRSPKYHGKCGRWFQTFLSHVDEILLNLDRERAAGSFADTGPR